MLCLSVSAANVAQRNASEAEWVDFTVGRVFVSTDIVLLGWPAAGGSTFAHHCIESIVPRREQSHRHVR